MLIRCKYAKCGEMAFVSHLDLLRIFIRSLRRASVDLEYSQGFHPHPKISFSPALSLGVESICEYVDFETKEDFDLEGLKDRINFAFPNGVKILSINSGIKLPKISDISNYSEYEISFENASEKMQIAIENILKSESIIISKKSKKGKFVETDIRDRIYSAKLVEDKIRVILLNSNNGAMKPMEFVELINRFSEEDNIVSNILKTNLYYFDGKEMSLVN